jgi:hypothetical protein
MCTTRKPGPASGRGQTCRDPASSTQVGRSAETRGAVRIGRTLSINPGSEYNDGILRGVIVTLAEKGLKHHQLLAG